MHRYATFYTMLPVFSLVLDEDVSTDIAFRFPELYRDIQMVRNFLGKCNMSGS